MKTIAALAIAALVPIAAHAAGPANPADRYDYNMRSQGTPADPQRSTNKDGYVPDTQRAGDKFDPYTQGAKQDTSSSLADDKDTQSKPPGKPHSKKAPAK
ncbi:hypothetical protein CupriaWKF_08550 [Cupriavidus sp. WKF15]|uniref:hypothetical protein n=1 Tax=Cupriavidus sp. WKF15 TaxID=3032282 RepID=UPI0023E0E91E|nr:hypothetical protein [Cupriavidus sp. WKF15]WER47575.1 hypothetical protein CupriaWKF_08550 [Cupriavidus sp. WKF15]